MTDPKPRVSIYTLGCRLNQAESALIADDLQRHGYMLTPWGQAVELAVINSCAVTATAVRKTGQIIRGVRRRCPGAFVALVGCGVDMDLHKWKGEAAPDLVLPNALKKRLFHYLAMALTQRDYTLPNPTLEISNADGVFYEDGCGYYPEKTRANLKIQDGCDHRCAYCIVPALRGPARSRAWNDVLREASALIERGHLELVLTGVNIATYRAGERDLADLVERLLELPGQARIRLSSTEPGAVLPRLIKLMAQTPRLCPYLHLPLQYGEDAILKAMNRRYSVADYTGLAVAAVRQVDGLCLGTDIIVGFPGETAATFATCASMINELPLSYLHIFTYSPRPGTPAAKMKRRVPREVARGRHQQMSAIGERHASDYVVNNVGRTVAVITETRQPDGSVEGTADNYLRVLIDSAAADVALNRNVQVCIIGVNPTRKLGVFGRLV